MLEKLKTEKAIRLDFLTSQRQMPPLSQALGMVVLILKRANLLLLGAALLLILTIFLFRYRTSRLQSQMTSVSDLKRAYAAALEISELRERLALSESAEKRKSLLANQLSELSHAIPWGAWVNSLSISEKQMSLSGGALSQELLIKTLRALESLAWVKKVSLQQSSLQPLPQSPGVAAMPGAQPSMHAVFDILCEMKP